MKDFKDISILQEQEVFNDTLIVQKALIKRRNSKYERVRLKRVDAVAVFLYNTDTKKVVLVRQFRYAISDKVKGPILEIMAGKIDGNDSPEATAIREAEEECGYRLDKKNLKLISEFFASPGYTSEKFYLYYCAVTNADKIAAGGGLAEENEDIEIVEMDYNDFMVKLDSGEINDAKTIIAGLYVQLHGLI